MEFHRCITHIHTETVFFKVITQVLGCAGVELIPDGLHLIYTPCAAP